MHSPGFSRTPSRTAGPRRPSPAPSEPLFSAEHLFLQTFWQTVTREWTGIDRRRLDKLCMVSGPGAEWAGRTVLRETGRTVPTRRRLQAPRGARHGSSRWHLNTGRGVSVSPFLLPLPGMRGGL